MAGLPRSLRSGIISPVSLLSIGLRRRWFALLRKGSLVLLLAFLPSVLYLGHWGELIDSALDRTAVVRSAEAAGPSGHAAHCHAGPASCSDQPVPASVAVIASVVELPPIHLMAHESSSDALVFSEFILTPPTEPPRL